MLRDANGRKLCACCEELFAGWDGLCQGCREAVQTIKAQLAREDGEESEDAEE